MIFEELNKEQRFIENGGMVKFLGGDQGKDGTDSTWKTAINDKKVVQMFEPLPLDDNTNRYEIVCPLIG